VSGPGNRAGAHAAAVERLSSDVSQSAAGVSGA